MTFYFFVLVSPLLMVSPGAVRPSAPPLDATENSFIFHTHKHILCVCVCAHACTQLRVYQTYQTIGTNGITTSANRFGHTEAFPPFSPRLHDDMQGEVINLCITQVCTSCMAGHQKANSKVDKKLDLKKTKSKSKEVSNFSSRRPSFRGMSTDVSETSTCKVPDPVAKLVSLAIRPHKVSRQSNKIRKL